MKPGVETWPPSIEMTWHSWIKFQPSKSDSGDQEAKKEEAELPHIYIDMGANLAIPDIQTGAQLH